LSEEQKTPGQDLNLNVAMNLGPESAGTEGQRNDANPDPVPQTGAFLAQADLANDNHDAVTHPRGLNSAAELYKPPPSFDLVKDAGSVKVSFVLWRGRDPAFSTHGRGASYQGKSYSVPHLPAAVFDAMYLPTNVTTDFSARQVFEGVCHILRGCPALSDAQCELLSFWCIATWFADRLDFIPRMTITGSRYAADLLFALLRRLCRRAILLAGIKPAVLQQIPINLLLPTLLIRQINASKSANELLDASDRRNYFVACGKELNHYYCAKCIYVGERYDPQHAGKGLYIHFARNASFSRVELPSENTTQDLQNQLFTYRSFYLNRRFDRDTAQLSHLSGSELMLQFDMIAQRLGAVIFEDSELCDRMLDLLKTQNEQLRVDGASGIEATVLRSLLSHCHENEPHVYVHTIAAGANQIWSECGETSKLGNEKVGHVLRKLGLYTRRLGYEGRGLVLDKSQQLRVHQLAFEYDVLSAIPECGHCHKLQAPDSEELM
jgi:hypothetical protein